ncbi:MAG TPA: hypothetical protein VGM41_12675 [Chitinophagaceae bacterium]
MKKLFAIFAFLIFFFSQFGKVINFCLCSVETYQQTSSFHCDCEKQLVATTDTDANKQPHSNPVQASQAEDLYHLDNSIAFSCTASFAPLVIYLHTHTEPLYNGYYNNIFHPPGKI